MAPLPSVTTAPATSQLTVCLTDAQTMQMFQIRDLSFGNLKPYAPLEGGVPDGDWARSGGSASWNRGCWEGWSRGGGWHSIGLVHGLVPWVLGVETTSALTLSH